MRSTLFASLLAAAAGAACSSEPAFADQLAAPAQPGARIALGIAPEKMRAPYDVQVVRENGETLPTYASKGRFYVQGNNGERYTIRVTNPTDHRVEAVVAVDGLDVVDGDEGDLRKRGYIVPAYGDVRIEGFRTSLEDVATFRFSSVDGSYAGKKGKARNVGVIAVAIFEEQHAPEQQIIVGDARPTPPPPTTHRVYNYEDDVDASSAPRAGADAGEGRWHGTVSKADKPAPRHEAAKKRAAEVEAPTARRPSPPPAPTTTATGGYAGAGAPAGAPAPRAYRDYAVDEEMGPPPAETPAPQTNRMGLGTEYGEQRNSSASYTRFVRAPGRPIAIAELRYNDLAGLVALGVAAQPLPDAGEIMTRETADPFPGDPHFSHSP
jgi:hypothetical protein